jgi:hypothetical protein
MLNSFFIRCVSLVPIAQRSRSLTARLWQASGSGFGMADGSGMLPLGNEFKEREIIFKFWPQMNAKYANSGKLTGLLIQLVAEFTQSKFHP